MKEIWKDIIGYEGLYKISNQGRIWSCYSNKVKTESINDGHCYVDLYRNGKRKTYAVHRLVASHFVYFVPEYDLSQYDVHHLDEVAWHNMASNLVFMYRQNHVEYHKTESSKNTCTWRKVICMDTNTQYASAGEAARDLITRGITTAKVKTVTNSIREACLRVHGSAYGFYWEYKGVL